MGNTINVQGSYIDIHNNKTVTSCAPSVELLPLSVVQDIPTPMQGRWRRRRSPNTHPKSLSPTPSEGGEKKPLPRPLSQGEGSKMQIDLANTLVHKVYFVYHALFIISPQAWSPLPWGGVGGRFWERCLEGFWERLLGGY